MHFPYCCLKYLELFLVRRGLHLPCQARQGQGSCFDAEDTGAK